MIVESSSHCVKDAGWVCLWLLLLLLLVSDDDALVASRITCTRLLFDANNVVCVRCCTASSLHVTRIAQQSSMHIQSIETSETRRNRYGICGFTRTGTRAYVVNYIFTFTRHTFTREHTRTNMFSTNGYALCVCVCVSTRCAITRGDDEFRIHV